MDVLDGVPADLQMIGDVLDGHMPRQLQGVALEGPGVVLLGIGKADGRLADGLALVTPEAWNLKGNEGGLGANGNGVKDTFPAPCDPDISGTTLRGAEPITRLVDAEDCYASVEMLADILVANQAKRTYQ